MAEKWFCFADIKYYNDDEHFPYHEKAILYVESLEEALEQVTHYIGNDITEISFKWAGQPNQKCKEELFFTESEFDRFNTVKEIIEDDRSYEDYKRAVEKYERSKQN